VKNSTGSLQSQLPMDALWCFHVSSNKTYTESAKGKVKGTKASASAESGQGFMVEIKKGTDKGHVMVIKTDANSGEQMVAAEQGCLGGLLKGLQNLKDAAAGSQAKVYHTKVVAIEDIDWIEQVDTSTESGATMGQTNCFQCIPCCKPDDEEYIALTKTQLLKIHLKYVKDPIPVFWEDAASDRPSDKPMCCTPTMGYSLKKNEEILGDGTLLTHIKQKEQTQPPKCNPFWKLCGGIEELKKSEIKSKYYIDSGMKAACHDSESKLASLAQMVLNLQVADRHMD